LYRGGIRRLKKYACGEEGRREELATRQGGRIVVSRGGYGEYLIKAAIPCICRALEASQSLSGANDLDNIILSAIW
jgi:hypothetical protein